MTYHTLTTYGPRRCFGSRLFELAPKHRLLNSDCAPSFCYHLTLGVCVVWGGCSCQLLSRSIQSSKIVNKSEPSWHHRARRKRSYDRALLPAFSGRLKQKAIQRLESAYSDLSSHHGSLPPSTIIPMASWEGGYPKGGKSKGKGGGKPTTKTNLDQKCLARVLEINGVVIQTKGRTLWLLA